jgi:hypothetical protein
MKKFDEISFESIDGLARLGEQMPVAERVLLTEFGEFRDRYPLDAGRFAAIVSEGRLHQVASNVYDVVQNRDLVRSVVANFAELGLEDYHGEIKSWDGRIWISMTSKEEKREPVVGDPHAYGFRFWNSYDGSTSVGCGFYVLRLVCKNGLVAWRREMAQTHIHIGIADVVKWLRKAIDAVRLQEASFEAAVKAAALQRIEGEMDPVFEQLGIGPMVREKIRKQLDLGAEPTAYDMVNAVTYYASHDLRERPVAAERYMGVARRILENPQLVVVRERAR